VAAVELWAHPQQRRHQPPWLRPCPLPHHRANGGRRREWTSHPLRPDRGPPASAAPTTTGCPRLVERPSARRSPSGCAAGWKRGGCALCPARRRVWTATVPRQAGDQSGQWGLARRTVSSRHPPRQAHRAPGCRRRPTPRRDPAAPTRLPWTHPRRPGQSRRHLPQALSMTRRPVAQASACQPELPWHRWRQLRSPWRWQQSCPRSQLRRR